MQCNLAANIDVEREILNYSSIKLIKIWLYFCLLQKEAFFHGISNIPDKKVKLMSETLQIRILTKTPKNVFNWIPQNLLFKMSCSCADLFVPQLCSVIKCIDNSTQVNMQRIPAIFEKLCRNFDEFKDKIFSLYQF